MKDGTRTTQGSSSLFTAVVEWLVKTGYPFDWTSKHQPPDGLIRPLAEEWKRVDGDDQDDLTVDDYEATVREEIGV